jgi:hypothetical protein
VSEVNEMSERRITTFANIILNSNSSRMLTTTELRIALRCALLITDEVARMGAQSMNAGSDRELAKTLHEFCQAEINQAKEAKP